jgi:crotonobetainyl-CoA:carnitine CoA-transferase CaiB-like acyl-CoA transferase
LSTSVMAGVRVLEVAEHTFVPAASALLADWGAEVIKIEPTERGDAMRGLAASGVIRIDSDVHVLLEHSNRGKRSLALDLTSSDGLDILYRLVRTADVFLTNKLPRVRCKLKIELDDIRAHNANIIYVAGTGQGERGPDADKGSYDSLAFWCRAGVAMGGKPADSDRIPTPPAPGFGDSIGAMTIAGGIMGALYHRATTGEATTVDVSLMGTGMWAMGQAFALSLAANVPWQGPPSNPTRLNPLATTYETSDNRVISFTCLQAGKYWAPLCALLKRNDLATDPRFGDHAALLEHCREAKDALSAIFRSRSLADWRNTLAEFSGQWAVVQDTLEAAIDPQTEANDYMQDCQTASGVPFRLVSAPVQFGGEAASTARAPEFNEHGDAILEELGMDWDAITDLKVRSIVG